MQVNKLVRFPYAEPTILAATNCQIITNAYTWSSAVGKPWESRRKADLKPTLAQYGLIDAVKCRKSIAI
jgi:hypothetical protein